MKNTYKIGAFFVMSILASAISAQTVYDSKTLVDTNSASTSTSTVNSNNVNTNNNLNVNTTTVDSKSVNTNTNINDSKSVSTNNNYQFGTMTNNNNNVSVSTSTSTSDNKNLNINKSTSVSDNKNVKINTSTSNSISASTSVNDNKNLNINTSTAVSDNKNVNLNNSTSTSASTSVNDNKNTSISTSFADSRQVIDSANMNTNINKSEIVQRVIQPPPTAIAPTMMSGGNSDLCSTGSSGSVQTQIFGVSSGGTVRDLNCESLKLSKTLYDMGMKVAAVATMCQDRRVYDAMLAAGTPCPYEGKIGEQAKAAWEANPDKIPQIEKVEKYETAKNIGMGALLGLLASKLQ
jgi:hypothetical protein